MRLADRDIIIEGDNDEFLKGIGIDGVILHTPGHTRDSISVLLSDGSAFVGDAAMNFLRWTGVGTGRFTSRTSTLCMKAGGNFENAEQESFILLMAIAFPPQN